MYQNVHSGPCAPAAAVNHALITLSGETSGFGCRTLYLRERLRASGSARIPHVLTCTLRILRSVGHRQPRARDALRRNVRSPELIAAHAFGGVRWLCRPSVPSADAWTGLKGRFAARSASYRDLLLKPQKEAKWLMPRHRPAAPGSLRCSVRAGREELASLRHLRAYFRPTLRFSAAPRQMADRFKVGVMVACVR